MNNIMYNRYMHRLWLSYSYIFIEKTDETFELESEPTLSLHFSSWQQWLKSAIAKTRLMYMCIYV